jgi:hypothetical protein
MNASIELYSCLEIANDEQLLRDLADIEVVLVGGGDIVGTGH